jgi:hypothetical protein
MVVYLSEGNSDPPRSKSARFDPIPSSWENRRLEQSKNVSHGVTEGLTDGVPALGNKWARFDWLWSTIDEVGSRVQARYLEYLKTDSTSRRELPLARRQELQDGDIGIPRMIHSLLKP